MVAYMVNSPLLVSLISGRARWGGQAIAEFQEKVKATKAEAGRSAHVRAVTERNSIPGRIVFRERGEQS